MHNLRRSGRLSFPGFITDKENRGTRSQRNFGEESFDKISVCVMSIRPTGRERERRGPCLHVYEGLNFEVSFPLELNF